MLTKWVGRYRYHRLRAHKLGKLLSRLVLRKYVQVFHRTKQLLSVPFFEGFALEREYYLYQIANREFEQRADLMGEAIERDKVTKFKQRVKPEQT